MTPEDCSEVLFEGIENSQGSTPLVRGSIESGSRGTQGDWKVNKVKPVFLNEKDPIFERGKE